MNFYKSMYLVGFALMMLLNVFAFRWYATSRKRAILYTLVTYVYGVLGALSMGKIYTAICRMKGVDESSNVAIFGAVIFTPLLLLLTILIERAIVARMPAKTYKNKHNKTITRPKPVVSTRDTLDLLTPGIFIILTCAKLGCSVEGCCYGVLCDWGVYSTRAAAMVFPVQIFEVCTMLVVLLLAFLLKRTRFYRRGMAYPLTAALYTVGRFGWEFMRFYAPEMRRLIFGMTMWQFCCVIVFIASVISLIVLYKTGESSPLPKRMK